MKTKSLQHKLLFLFLASLTVTVSFSNVLSNAFAQKTQGEPDFYMGILILESQQQQILDSIKKVKELQLGNMVVLHPMDQAWNLTLIEQAISQADSLGLYVTFETFNASDHLVRIAPEIFGDWQARYPHLLGVLVQEITGKQIDGKLWENNSTGTITTRLEAEKAIVHNITESMMLPEFKQNGAKILLQENVISYASANTSYCDVLMCKVFNAPNLEMMIGLTRGMAKSFDIPDWGIWVDTWREWVKPPAFSPNDVERALYEGWFYGARYFFFEQGNFFGTLNRDWDNKFIILDQAGKLTEYGKVLQRFYTFILNQKSMSFSQPDYKASIAVMIGQSGWGSRGPDWGLWDQSDRDCDCDYRLLNLFFPGVGDNWKIGSALTGKEITGLPFGMVDLISIYAPASVLKQYDVVIGLGWSVMNDAIAANIGEYVDGGGVFVAPLSFTHSNPDVDILVDGNAWTKSFSSIFGVNVMTFPDNALDVSTDTNMHSVTFTQDTYWFPWNDRTYRYYPDDEDVCWFWKFKYQLSESPNTRVVAWLDGIQSYPNAFIIENKKGSGYTYMINSRNLNSLPNGVLTDVITDFIYYLCAYYVRPMTYLPYPETEYWLSQGQSDNVVYLNHDNSTATQTFQYYMRALEAGLIPGKEYLVFDYFNRQFYGMVDDWVVSLNVTLQSNQAKLYVFIENNGEPQVIYSNTIISSAALTQDRRLPISLKGAEESANTTLVYCSEYGQPRYILGLAYNIAHVYDQTNKFLTITSDTDFTVGWDNTTSYSVESSTVALTGYTWNNTLGTLTLLAKGTTGQSGTVKVQTGTTKPDYLKVNGVEVSTWSYNQATGVVDVRFTFPANEVVLTLGFKSIEIDKTYVSKERADVGSTQTVGLHVAWMRDGADIANAKVLVNDIEYTTNATGWISLDTSSSVVGKSVLWVNSVNYNGLTDYAKSVADPQIIWDHINITDFSVFENVVQVGSTQTVWATAEYTYDSARFMGTNGTLYFNDEPMVWSPERLRWEYNVTSSELGQQVNEVTSVVDQAFGLTTMCNQADNINITYDSLKVADVKYETNTLGATKVTVHVEYSFTKNPVVGANVLVNDIRCTETQNGIYVCEITDWTPIPTYRVDVDYPNFLQGTRTVSGIHVMNMLMYLVIGLAVVITATVLFKKRKITKQGGQTV
ncbi:MAG: hypothetical protein WC325_04540 [Candidatus Bathyarchaeia archaeon]